MSRIPGPVPEYFIRETKHDELFGPLTYYVADMQARTISKINKTGVIELVVRLGQRLGDPVETPHKLSVIAIYIRGRLVLTGAQAQYNSDHQSYWPGLS